MNDETPTTERALAEIKDSPLACTDDGSVSHLLDQGKFEQMQRVASLMAKASLIPDHLTKGSKEQTLANCFLVVNQAFRWGLDPFSVAPETYSVGGKLAFQGKLIAAVVNARAGLRGRLQYGFTGKEGTDARTVTVSGAFADDPGNVLQVTVNVGKAKTSNDMWRKDPDQKLCYNGAIKWARRYCPEAMLGVLTDDDLQRMEDNGGLDADGLGKRARYAPLAPPAVLPSPTPPAEPDADTPEPTTDAERFEAENPPDGKTGELFDEKEGAK